MIIFQDTLSGYIWMSLGWPERASAAERPTHGRRRGHRPEGESDAPGVARAQSGNIMAALWLKEPYLMQVSGYPFQYGLGLGGLIGPTVDTAARQLHISHSLATVGFTAGYL